MTKRADSKNSGQRRRRAGLRVPSDSVPRRASEESAAVAPDDGGVVSVAYAYEDEDEAGEDAIAEIKEEAGEELLSDDINDTQAFQMRPEDMVEDDESGDESRAAAAPKDGASAAPEEIGTGDSVDIPFDDDDATAIQELPPEMRADIESRRAAEQAATVESRNDGPDEAGKVSAEPATATQEAVESAPEVKTDELPAAPVVDQDKGGAGAEDAPEPPKSAEEPPQSAAAPPQPAAAPPQSAADAGKQPRFIRANTMSLSDQDLEEVIEEASGATAMPAESPADAVPESARVSSAADSGEIVADDLLEEVDPEDSEPVREAVELSTDEVEEVGGPAGEDADAAKSQTAAEPPPPPPSPPRQSTAPKPPPAPAAATEEPAPEKREKRRRKGKPWFDELFDEDYLRTLPFLTPQATQLEANFVMESLGVDPGAQVLDVACGYGRHAMELAARGFHVVGLDYSLPLLLRGADEAQRRGLTINFVHGDMREMTFESQFDGAYCLFSSFGYFDDETNKKTAQHIARALKPGARFVVEVLNRDYLVADLPSRVWWEGDGCVVLEEVEFNYFSSRIVSNRSVVFDDGRQLEQEISMRSFSLHELGKLLHAAGFRVLEISGSMATRGRFFGAHSRDIVVVAERRQPKGESEDAARD